MINNISEHYKLIENKQYKIQTTTQLIQCIEQCTEKSEYYVVSSMQKRLLYR